jgi:anti-sigma-K factor RskA
MMSDSDLAAAYVLGALEPEEARAFEERLARSPALQRQVQELREVSTLLSLGSPAPPRSDDALKQRLMARVRRHGGTAATPPTARPRPSWPMWAGWVAAAATVVVLLVQQRRLQDIDEQLATVQQQTDSIAQELAQRQALLDDILGPETSVIRLTATGETPPGIRMFWNPSANRVVLHASNLPPAPEGGAYQLWFVGSGAPIPGGTFDTEADGSAVVTLAGPAAGEAFEGAAVTLEPEGGSATPTPPIIMSGEL